MRPDHPVGPIEPFQPLSDEVRQASLAAALADKPPGGDFWVFAYGSLLWRPDMTYSEKRACQLPGHHRDFTIWTVLGRGSPEFPGLGLALTPGGEAVGGLAYRLDTGGPDFQADLERLWDREMYTGIYSPHWLPAQSSEGPISVLAFVVERSHRQYAGPLSFEDKATILAHAAGRYGSGADYLAETVAQMDKVGLPDEALEALNRRVQENLAQK